MPTVKIGVGADAGSVSKAIDQITNAMNRMGQAVSKSQGLKFEDTSAKLMARDLELVNRQFTQAIKLSAALRNAMKATGQEGKSISQVDFSKLSANPQVAQRMRDRAFLHSVKGSSLDPTLANEVDANGNIVPPSASPRPAPAGGSGGSGGSRPPGGGGRSGGEDGGGGWRRGIGRVFRGGLRGAGGGVEAVGTGAMEGAAGGAGMLGGLGGLLGGAAIGAAGFGAYKLISSISQGMDLARQQDASFETIKRSMGDLGASFDQLRSSADTAGKGLGILPVEFAQLEAERQQASSGIDRNPGDLSQGTATSAAFAKAYGIDPHQAVGSIGMMQRSSGSSTRELVVMLADAIEKSKGNALPAQVLQMMQGFMSSTSRMSLSDANGPAFGNAFGSMLGIGGAGMTPDNVASMIATANSALQHGTGAGEAGWNMTARAALSTGKVSSAVQIDALNTTGLFGTRNIAFGPDTTLAKFMHAEGHDAEMTSLRGGIGGDTTNLESDMSQLRRDNSDPWNLLSAIKRTFGLDSIEQASALGLANDKGEIGSLGQLLKRNKLDFAGINAGGLQTLGDISGAKSMKDLQSIYDGRKGDLSSDEQSKLQDAIKSGSLSGAEDAFAKTFAGKDRQATPVSVEQDINATLQQMKADAGRMLYPQTDLMMKGIGQLVSVGLPALQKISDAVASVENFFTKPNAMANPQGPRPTEPGAAGDVTRAAFDATHSMSDNFDPKAAAVNDLYGKGIGKVFSYRDSVSGGMSQLGGMGIDKAHAAAIIANAIGESSMNPDAGNGDHYGIFQLDPARQKDYQKIMGRSIVGSSAADQIAYMVKSMQPGGEEAAQGKKFWGAQGLDATRVMATDVERVDHPSRNSDIRAGIASELYGDDGKVPEKYRAASPPAGGSHNYYQPGYTPSGNLDINITSDMSVKGGDGKVYAKKVTSTFTMPSAGQKNVTLSH